LVAIFEGPAMLKFLLLDLGGCSQLLEDPVMLY
jgi:hypothetical protein